MVRYSLSRNEGGRTAEPVTPVNKKSKNSVYDTPQISGRFVKSYVGLRDNTARRDPRKFSLSNGVWEEWSPDRFRRFIHYVQRNIDLVPFARQEDVPVEEVQEVFSQSIIQDMYAMEAPMGARMNARMRRNIDDLEKKGEKVRTWGEEGVRGTLFKIHMGQIELYTKHEEEVLLKLSELTESDLEYLKAPSTALIDHDWKLLHTNPDELRKSMSEPGDVEMAD